MTKFFIENFGCRATDADATALRAGLSARDLVPTKDCAHADFVILNTCTVTAAADSQARDAVRRIHKLNPSAQIIVTGCYAQRAPAEIAELDGVSYVVSNSRQNEILDIVSHASHKPLPATDPGDFIPLARLDQEVMSLSRGPAKILTGDIFAQTAIQLAPASLGAGERTRPILKIQDGCNNRCAYCVIPFVRGRSRSLHPDTVVDEAQALVEAGAKEIVLSGINLGSYGRDLSPRASLASIVCRILGETKIDQLRFSSIEPQDVTEDFVSMFAASERLAPHFHIPLQSGSDHTLRSMHRWYRTALYAERINIIRRLVPHAAIGADVIVGFPGETDGDFQATVQFIKSRSFTYLHVFSFSVRPGTEASKGAAEVPLPLIRERARTLRSLGCEKGAAFRASQAGHRLRALTLARGGDNWTEALTSNYLKTRVAGRWPANQWLEVTVGQDEREIRPALAASVFKNDLSESEVAAMGDRQRDIFHTQSMRHLPGHPVEI